MQVMNKYRVHITILEGNKDITFLINENLYSNALRILASLEFDGNITGITIGPNNISTNPSIVIGTK